MISGTYREIAEFRYGVSLGALLMLKRLAKEGKISEGLREDYGSIPAEPPYTSLSGGFDDLVKEVTAKSKMVIATCEGCPRLAIGVYQVYCNNTDSIGGDSDDKHDMNKAKVCPIMYKYFQNGEAHTDEYQIGH